MKYVCAYCLKEYKEKDETGNPGDTSHGACRECYEMAMKTIDAGTYSEWVKKTPGYKKGNKEEN